MADTPEFQKLQREIWDDLASVFGTLEHLGKLVIPKEHEHDGTRGEIIDIMVKMILKSMEQGLRAGVISGLTLEELETMGQFESFEEVKARRQPSRN